MENEPSAVDSTDYGWMKDELISNLVTIRILPDTSVADLNPANDDCVP